LPEPKKKTTSAFTEKTRHRKLEDVLQTRIRANGGIGDPGGHGAGPINERLRIGEQNCQQFDDVVEIKENAVARQVQE